MNIKFKVLTKVGLFIKKVQSFRAPKKLESNKPKASYDLVYFSGQKGLPYLNASLYSVFKNWKELPNVYILTDGTPVEVMRKGLSSWPKNLTIITWHECAEYFKAKGFPEIAFYAEKDVFGKKLACILYMAEKKQILYSDTDVLWFKQPTIPTGSNSQPLLSLMQEADGYYYNEELIEVLQEEQVFNYPALNAGVIFSSGDFSVYPKWKAMFNFIASNPDKWKGIYKGRNWTEQTVFAILSNHFKSRSWTKEEILIEIVDQDEIIPNAFREAYKKAYGRHYVSAKAWLFWRDYFLYI